jgi:hypothetical protein
MGLMVTIWLRPALRAPDTAGPSHDDLAQAHGSVADIAYHWGFTNLGRFARAYHDRFGEFPAATSTGDAPTLTLS